MDSVLRTSTDNGVQELPARDTIVGLNVRPTREICTAKQDAVFAKRTGFSFVVEGSA